MTNTLETSSAAKVAMHPAVSKANILLFGMLAVIYARSAPACPIRGWASGEQVRSITLDGFTYSASQVRKKTVPGCRLTVREDFGGKAVVFDAFTPWSAFESLGGLLDIPWESVA